MKAYQPTVLNTLDPYSGPQGYGMNRYTGQTIDQQTTVGVNQIDPVPFRGYSTPTPALAFYGLSDDRDEMQRKGPTGRVIIPGAQPGPSTRPIITTGSRILAPVIVPTQPAPAAPVTVNIEPSAPQVKPWYKSPLYIALLAAGALLAARKFKLV
ncbi:MAG: hypothetical protein EBS18_02400 [Actinobacteria bacterium]|nr:hypothetical protein [Actinomycetota bacterium]